MNRRGFLSALVPFGATAAIAATTPTPSVVVSRHSQLQCPTCGLMMLIVTKRTAMHPKEAWVWTCGPCQSSYEVAPITVAARAVPFDDGMRR